MIFILAKQELFFHNILIYRLLDKHMLRYGAKLHFATKNKVLTK